MTADELDSVATFYNLIFRRPVGRHVILVCDSVSCWIMGYEPLRAHLSKQLGDRASARPPPTAASPCCPIVCLGACDQAPGDDDRRRPARAT